MAGGAEIYELSIGGPLSALDDGRREQQRKANDELRSNDPAQLERAFSDPALMRRFDPIEGHEGRAYANEHRPFDQDLNIDGPSAPSRSRETNCASHRFGCEA